ncbi:AraC family transcriptional regulator [Pseudoalteromonas phenolica]|uniref:AraC family transcriptional regulator n=1 Tax=Pseudoalteromonas phenolica TaxID=161398 RepID=A0A5S3YS74_9GAMM|nr:helix-turn-helix transcriptional regulator [Pseudoalteromonas phenolica]TMP79978.1 AraC family transcriptional regulator [Pseudoalteromonas phenolica]
MQQHVSSQLLIEPGVLAIFGAVPKTVAHQHTLIQITLPMDDADMRLTLPNHDEIQLTGASIINQAVSHQLTMQSGWVILIEPSCKLGKQLTAKLADKAFIEIEINKKLDSTHNLSELLGLCGLTPALQTILDARIARLLDKLNLCIGKECVKPQQWRAADIAIELNLSESRFLHLFKDTMQIPWRPYLLWRRLICALQTLQQGKTATEAAYIAGFSDSAHLSRTFKKQFGLSLRDYYKKA